MAELILYPTESDELPIISLALQSGCKLVPDLDYPRPQYECLTNLDDYKNYRSRTRVFLLVSDVFFRHPLEMRQIEKQDLIVYYIFDRTGGPTIFFNSGGVIEEAGVKSVRPGSIGHHPTYWTEDHRVMKPAAELVETYKVLQKLIRRSFLHSKPGNVSFWIGPDAVEDVKNGAKLVGYEKYSAAELLK